VGLPQDIPEGSCVLDWGVGLGLGLADGLGVVETTGDFTPVGVDGLPPHAPATRAAAIRPRPTQVLFIPASCPKSPSDITLAIAS